MINKGDSVVKTKGYKFNGVVVGVATKLDGKKRYVVENPDGILHIFREDQLEKVIFDREPKKSRYTEDSV